jgi:hypothetical protein
VGAGVDDRYVLGAERFFFLDVDNVWLQQLLGDQRRHDPDTITTVNSSVYWVVSMRWWVRPNSAEIDPEVNPVAMSSVV